MKIRLLCKGFALFLGFLFLLNGCTQKKTYTLSGQGEKTARITFPGCIEIGDFDRDSVGNLFSGIIDRGEKEVIFPAGTHTVEIRYNDTWNIDDNDHEKIVSEYIALQFESTPGSTYKISVDVPKDRRSAWKLATHFKAEIIDARTGKSVSRLVNE